MFEAIITFRVPVKTSTAMTKGDVTKHIEELKEKFLETSLSDNKYFGEPQIEVTFENVAHRNQYSFDFED